MVHYAQPAAPMRIAPRTHSAQPELLLVRGAQRTEATCLAVWAHAEEPMLLLVRCAELPSASFLAVWARLTQPLPLPLELLDAIQQRHQRLDLG
jgi:hypothetical protein